jgi:hypothetical protein
MGYGLHWLASTGDGEISGAQKVYLRADVRPLLQPKQGAKGRIIGRQNSPPSEPAHGKGEAVQERPGFVVRRSGCQRGLPVADSNRVILMVFMPMGCRLPKKRVCWRNTICRRLEMFDLRV